MADSAADLEAHNGSSSATQTAKDLFSGAAGGIAQVLIGTSPLPEPPPPYLYVHVTNKA
jgi:hypothetical protein